MEQAIKSASSQAFCGNCGGPFPATNKFCSQCGSARAAEPTAPKVAQPMLLTERIIVVCAIAAALFFISAVAWAFYAVLNRPGSAPVEKSADDRLADAGKSAVVAQLRDPTSAVFSNTRGVAQEGCAYGTVNAKNGFGGYQGADDYVVKQGVVTFQSAGFIPYMEAVNDCGDQGARNQLKTETDPKMRRLLQTEIEAHSKFEATK